MTKHKGEIAKHLSLEEIPTRNNASEWLRGTILSILKNETYTGKIRWNNRKRTREYIDGKIEKTRRSSTKDKLILVDGKHPAIIEPELFVSVQSKFGKVAPTDNKKLINVFAGVLRCKFCGRCMLYNHFKSSTSRSRYTHPLTNNCGVRSAVSEHVVDAVFQALKEKLEGIEIELKNYKNNGSAEKHKKAKNALKNELQKLNKKKSQLFDLLEDGIYTKEEFLERKEKLLKQISSAQKTLDEMAEPTENEIKLKAVKMGEIIESLKSDKISINRKNKLIKSILSRVDYNNKNEGIVLDIFFK